MKRFTLLLTMTAATLIGPAVEAQGLRGRGFGGPGMPGGQELKLVKQFDRNADGWLNSQELHAAREYARSQTGNFAGGRGPGPRGFGGGAPGGSAGEAQKGQSLRPGSAKRYTSETLYDEGVMRTLFVTFEDNDWERELEEFHGTDVDVPATVVMDGKTYQDVGFSFRGNSSYGMVPATYKRSFNVSLDMAHQEQNMAGYRSLNLLNSHEDPSMMRAVLFLHIARQYVPAAKANFVRVVINGEDWGVYQSVQQINKEFLKENFKETGGARWKTPGSPGSRAGLEYFGDDAASYNGIYEIKTKDDPAQWAALIHLCKVLNETPAGQLEARLSPILDIDGALRFLALDNVLVNGDGYWTRSSDYSIYRDMSGRFHVYPYDANEAFSEGGFPGGPGGPPGRGGRSFGPIGPGGFGGPGAPGLGPLQNGFDFPVGPGGRGPGGRGFGPGGGGPELDPLVGLDNAATPLRSKLLAVPALREKYLAYVRDIADKWLDWKTLGPIVEGYQQLMDPAVKVDTKKLDTYDAFLRSTTGTSKSLKAFAAARREYLLKSAKAGAGL